MHGCKRFHRLASEARDRELSATEEQFIDAHRNACDECRHSEHNAGQALNMLQMAALEPDVDPSFDTRVIRRLQVQTSRDSMRYWSPALVGAAIAGISVLAALQLIARTADIPVAGPKIGEAHLVQPRHGFPALELPKPRLR